MHKSLIKKNDNIDRQIVPKKTPSTISTNTQLLKYISHSFEILINDTYVQPTYLTASNYKTET